MYKYQAPLQSLYIVKRAMQSVRVVEMVYYVTFGKLLKCELKFKVEGVGQKFEIGENYIKVV